MKTIFKGLAATAAVAVAAPALAIDSSTVPASNILNISGATATNAALYELAILASGGVCEPGTADVYIDTAGPEATDANDQFMVACTGAAGSTLAGTPVLYTKESNGGSNNGTEQVARSLTLLFLDPSAPSCDAPFTVAAVGALQEYELHTNCTGTVSEIPGAGIADVEAALFTSTTAGDIANLSPSPLFQILFAPAVSLNLYRAMQLSQGLTQDDDPANVPNITRGQLEAIFAGVIGDWTSFKNPDGTTFATGATAPSGFGGAVTNIFICRRGEDSGTQASFTSFVLNERCNASVPIFVGPTTAGCLAEGCDWDVNVFNFDFIFAADGSSDVRACLDAKDDQGTYGIGVLSTNTSVNNTDREIRFLGVDGASPTLSSVANGGYHFVTENVLNVRSSAALPGGVPTGVAGDIVDFIVDNIGLPSIISGLNVSSRNPGGDHGVLGIANGTTILPNPPPVDQQDMRDDPISSFTRSAGGSANNCQPISAIADGQILGGLQ
ncbi:MAG: hypothetical protein AAFX44_01670 [Pseudomonadota bacterium]